MTIQTNCFAGTLFWYFRVRMDMPCAWIALKSTAQLNWTTDSLCIVRLTVTLYRARAVQVRVKHPPEKFHKDDVFLQDPCGSLIGCCSVSNFRAQLTTNQERHRDVCTNPWLARRKPILALTGYNMLSKFSNLSSSAKSTLRTTIFRRRQNSWKYVCVRGQSKEEIK